LQNEVGLNEYIDVGTRLDAQVSKELVSSIFMPGSPIHDGALIIQQGRITAAGCFLPLTTNPTVSKTLGTRHRAAIGLTEETDALAIVVAEEDGMVSLVREGKIKRDVDAATLRTTLQRLLVGWGDGAAEPASPPRRPHGGAGERRDPRPRGPDAALAAAPPAAEAPRRPRR